MKKTLVLFLFSLFVLNSSHAAKPDVWLSQNTFKIENIQISRPNTHWRVLDNLESAVPPCLIQFRYNKFRSNVNIDLCRHPEITVKRRWNAKLSKRDKKILLKNLLSPYHTEGYKFFKTDLALMSLRAEGVNKNNEIILLHYQFASNSKATNPIIVEMRVPQKSYLDFKMAFQAVADSLVIQ